MMLTWLRRIASCLFVTLAILSAALWVRSYWYVDTIEKREMPSDFGVRFRLRTGGASYYRVGSGAEKLPKHWRRISPRIYPLPSGGSVPSFFGFGWEQSSLGNGVTSTYIRVPFWFIVSIFVLLAIAIRPKPRFKFGLRDLFTLTTVAALTVGPLAFWLRSIG